MYIPPIQIEMLRSKVEEGLEEKVVQAVQSVGIQIDREALTQALVADQARYDAAYEAGVEAASTWIPVSPDYLPKDREIVLGLGRNGGVQLYEYWAPVGNERVGHFYTMRRLEATVTHWLPKPKLPEEVKA